MAHGNVTRMEIIMDSRMRSKDTVPNNEEVDASSEFFSFMTFGRKHLTGFEVTVYVVMRTAFE